MSAHQNTRRLVTCGLSLLVLKLEKRGFALFIWFSTKQNGEPLKRTGSTEQHEGISEEG